MLDYNQLKEQAVKIRKHIITALYHAGSGHPGGSLSAVEILTLLYFNKMNIDPQNPTKKNRDRFVLSKGHAAPVLYATLGERGYFPAEDMYTLRKIGSKFQGHPDRKLIPGVEMSTGSLGQGFSASIGMSLGHRLDKDSGRIFVLLGDGELQEGIVWEAAMSAGHYKLDNLTAFVDHNGLQIDGGNEEVMTIEPLDEKWRSFGWHVIMIDGHDFEQIDNAIEEAKKTKGKPTVIIAKTIKGEGVSFMENDYTWHGKAPNEDQASQALKELKGALR